MSRLRKISIAVGIGFCVAILVPVVHHYQLRFALMSYIGELKAKGEPIDLSQLMPPPVPPDQNGVPFIINSITNLDHRNIITTNSPTAMRLVTPGRAAIAWQQPDIRGKEGTNSWDDLGRALSDAKGTLDSFHNLSNHPVLDFNLDYRQGLFLRLPHLMPMHHAAYLLNASALYNLHEGNVTAACADVSTILALAKGQTEEPIIRSQGVRMTIARVGVYATWEILQNPNVSKNDLESLQLNWQALQFIKPFENALLMDRTAFIPYIEHLRKNPNELWDAVMASGDIQKMWCKNQWRWFWSYADEKRALQIDQVLIDATRMCETNHSYQSALSFKSSNFIELGIEAPDPEDNLFRIDIVASECAGCFLKMHTICSAS